MRHRLLIVTLVLAACGGTSVTVTTTASVTTTAPGATTTTSVPAVGPIPVILDYSPTVSDVGALVFLATHPGVRLIGVTLPGTGESHCDPGVVHTRGALQAIGLGAIPVACGPEEVAWPINPFPAGWRERSDSISLPGSIPNDDRSAPDLIADLVAGAGAPVEIVAVGPLTNLAIALETHPELVAGVRGITIMGGAVGVPGNVPPVEGWEHANRYAEVNFWVDPTAAAQVVASGVPITLVPLDATNFLPVDGPIAGALGSLPASVASRLLDTVWSHAPEWTTDGYFFWDELAAAVVVDEAIVTFETRNLVVDADGSTAGWSHDDPTGPPVRVAVSADREAFVRLFLETVLGRVLTVPTADESAYFADLMDMHDTQQANIDEVLRATATDLGLEEDGPEEDWGRLLVAAAPGILDGPLTDLLVSLEAMNPPGGLLMAHDGYVAALRDLMDHRAEFLAELAEAFADGQEPELSHLQSVGVACLALQDVAAEHGGWIDLSCF